MTSITTTAATDGLTILPEREAPFILREVYELVEDGCRSEIVVQLSEGYIEFRADADTDSLCFEWNPGEFCEGPHHTSVGGETDDRGPSSPWKAFMGKECGWTWVARNQQGYCDSVMLSFDGIVPNILLYVMCSSIYVYSIVAGGGSFGE